MVDGRRSSFDAHEAGTLYVDVRYAIRGLNDPRNLVFPFYVIPDEPTAASRRRAGRRPGGLSTMLPAPNLDDRHFQDLVDDAKRLVQQRCPEWTDHNVSDPGVTLIEAFAQMVDQLIYRLNRVPDLHYIKFLELIGVELRPPAAARGDGDLLAVGAAAADRRWSAARPRWPPRAPTSHDPVVFSTTTRPGDRAVLVRARRRPVGRRRRRSTARTALRAGGGFRVLLRQPRSPATRC